MAYGHGKNAAIAVSDENGVLKYATAYVTSAKFSGQGETAEVSTMGDAAKEYIRGLNDATLDIEGIWDPTIDNYLSNILDSEAGTTIFFPQGTASGKVKYTGVALETKYDGDAGLSDAVTFSASFQFSGAIAFGTV